MSLNSPMLSRRSCEIAASFGARAADYELHAGLQRAVTDKLATFLPELERPRGEVWPSRPTKYFLAIGSMFPSLADRVLRGYLRKVERANPPGR